MNKNNPTTNTQKLFELNPGEYHVGTDLVFLKKRKEVWTRSNWRISEQRIINLERSIERGEKIILASSG